MDVLSHSSDLSEKLIVLLQALSDSSPKLADDVFLEKVLTGIRNELFKNSHKFNNFEELFKFFHETLDKWNENPPTPNLLAFFIQLIGILCGNEEIFNCVRGSLLDTHWSHLKCHIYKNTHSKLTWIQLLSNVLSHKSGYQWIIGGKLWREITEMYLSNSGLFIEREAITVIIKLLEISNWESTLLEEILNAILCPLEPYREEFYLKRMNDKNIELYQKKLEGIIMLVLHAYIIILENWLISTNLKQSINVFTSTDIESFWKFLLETYNSDCLLEKVSIVYALHSISSNNDLQSLIQTNDIPDGLFNIFKILVKRTKILTVIKLAKFCQLLWNKLSVNNGVNSDLENHFIIIQMVPVLILLKKPEDENCLIEMYSNKLYDLISDNTLRIGYLIRDVVKYGENEYLKDYALQSVSHVSKNLETLNLNRAVLIFQGLANVMKTFVPRSREDESPNMYEDFGNGRQFGLTQEALISSILNAICVLIEKFKIKWTEALESLCLLKLSSMLLSDPNLPPRLGVQTLSLIKLAISNFMTPDLALLSNTIEGSSLEDLLNILYKRLHDQNWEIRDSCVEVIGIIADLADSKYPIFQEILIDRNYFELILSIIEGDSESYVRSSGLKTLAQMIKIERIRNLCLNKVDLIPKITFILRNESEGIVRREAALLGKELFESQNLGSNSLLNLYHIMGYAATSDLHWEVKVNALFFWEKVIERFMTDQGMIDGFFPSITFSKENKKIVSLTEEEIKLRLNKVLIELSNTGCLYVLISTLKDDYDFQVVQKSAQILTDLLDKLKYYGLIEKQRSETHQNDKSSVKRKSSDEGFPEKKIIYTSANINEGQHKENKSNRVIEDIVNEQDLILLGDVYSLNDNIPASEIQSFSVKKIKPEIFLAEIQDLNISNFLNAKRKWLLKAEDDLNELINDILTLSVEGQKNILDCY